MIGTPGITPGSGPEPAWIIQHSPSMAASFTAILSLLVLVVNDVIGWEEIEGGNVNKDWRTVDE